jgi:hypothetical protein
MFQNKELEDHLLNSSSVKTQSLISAEWNMNLPTNISLVGNYRYRPSDSTSTYYNLLSTFSLEDSTTPVKYYTGATDADISIDGGYSDYEQPTTLVKTKDKLKMLYSLEDCLKPFRPRSGINKASFIDGRYLHHANSNMAKRPRYYMPDKDDGFKYWTSFRTESGKEYGISSKNSTGQYFIDDAAPFVVYKNEVPTNRIVIKMQTHSGDIDLGPFSQGSKVISDPLYGDDNKSVPKRWKIQGLFNTSWIDLLSFNENSKRTDGSPVIKTDGYVEIAYGLIVPQKYRDVFVYAETYASEEWLPEESVNGYAYFIQANESEIGYFKIWFNGQYQSFVPNYGWYLQEDTVDRLTNFVTKLTSPTKYTKSTDNKNVYREFEFIKGLRIVAETMNKDKATLDLIEMSPRLCVNISDKVTKFNVKKNASDLGVSGLPVGQLLASTGSVSLFDYDNAFLNNPKSIVTNHMASNIQFKIYESIIGVNGYDYMVPIKTMYSEGFPKYSVGDRSLTVDLRDMFFYFENNLAPQILFRNASVSSAVSLLLDSIGFSNYVFKRTSGESEPNIPYFYIPPDKTVAEILNDIARSTQTAMFFDEYNNFVLMSKSYIMPTVSQRATDFTISQGSNMLDISSSDKNVYNDGQLTYQTRYIQKSFGSIRQASLIDPDKTWIYKPVLLWEVSGTENTKSVNGEVAKQSDFILSAIPLNSDLSDSAPYASNGKILNNTIDFGEGIYWITRYNGYFYSNGEVIRYDAVEYNVSGIGNIWITSGQEYSEYFAKLPFNGKIYPTGLVRIYSVPKYETVSSVTKIANGEVEQHGRAQFGTDIKYHNAGINSYWTSNSSVRGINMLSDNLFKTGSNATVGNDGGAGIDNTTAQKSSRSGIIKNFMSTTYVDEKTVNSIKSTQSGTIQSSAFVMSGPTFSSESKPIDFLTYVYKPLTEKFVHFGTRMRIVGKIENGVSNSQTPVGASTYFTVPGTTPDKNINVAGGSGGLGIMLNPTTNHGYYFEIIALGSNNISKSDSVNVNNLMFYKIKKDPLSDNAVPIKLWEGLGKIIVDNGLFTGQYRMASEENPTVYDLAVEYQDFGTTRRFYLYINGTLIKTVDDPDPLPKYNNMGVFVRGSSKCMFENIYALSSNYSQNTTSVLDTPVQSVFGDNEIDTNESFRRYAMTGVVQSTYLSGIDPAQPPKYNMYFEEFGTIMREASSFKIKYDKAYPALYAKMSPTFNRLKGYTVSGFRAGAYGAEFLVFNSTDTALSLDSQSGNYLRIQGVTFTQETNNTYSVDDYFKKNSNFSNPQFNADKTISSPQKSKEIYDDIKLSRMQHGKKDFSLSAPYIQSSDDAESLMKWLVNNVTKPRTSIGLKVFAMPTLQLGDIVKVDYSDGGVDVLGVNSKRFVVYSIDYSKSLQGPSMDIYLSEVA